MKKKAIQTDLAPKAIGPYTQAVETFNMLFISGQLGIDVQSGKLAEGVEDQAHCAMKNLGAILGSTGLTYGHVVKTTIFLLDINDFAKINQVYASYFDKEYPARSCVQAAALPLGGLVEIECVACRTS